MGRGAVRPCRVFVIDSYHRGYPWSDGIRTGLASALAMQPAGPDTLTAADGRFTAREVFLDTKRHPELAWREQQTRRVLGLIESWRPDVVVACDDNAVRDLVVPHLLGRDLPVVYCGVNWDASVYGLPARNVTGMTEVEQVPDLLAILRPLAAGDRVGLLLLDSTTGRRDAEIYQDQFALDLTVRLVPDYAAWKRAFVALQDQVDMLLIKQNVTGARDWNAVDAVAFAADHTRIPTGTTTEPMLACALVSVIKNPAEQGRWVAAALERIRVGDRPDEIPPGINRESRVVLNMTLARRLDARFPMALIERATFVEELWRP